MRGICLLSRLRTYSQYVREHDLAVVSLSCNLQDSTDMSIMQVWPHDVAWGARFQRDQPLPC